MGARCEDLAGWNGDPASPAIKELFSSIQHIILARANQLKIREKELDVPIFFRSVSSHETALQPRAAIQALKLVGCEAVLVSAYDIVHETNAELRNQMASDLASLQSKGSVILLDSGNYEASRKSDAAWSTDQLHQAFKLRLMISLFASMI